MEGAFGLKKGVLEGDILLNLDSETEGELYVGCAGGLDANVRFGYAAEPVPAQGYTAAKITVKGLKGGHSGIQIVCQRANANKLLFRLLRRWGAAHELLLCSVDGGGLRNAIPREAAATVAVRKEEFDAFVGEVRAFEAAMRSEFAGIEDGLVQTSTNLARVVSDGRTVQLQALLRSSVNSEKEALGDAMSALFELAGAEVELSGSYDGWNPNMDSPILKAMTESYERLYGRRPAVMAIHAGLECGVIGGVYPNLDMISFGPTICYPHSPDEKVEIASVAKFYEFLLHTLKHVPVKA